MKLLLPSETDPAPDEPSHLLRGLLFAVPICIVSWIGLYALAVWWIS